MGKKNKQRKKGKPVKQNPQDRYRNEQERRIETLNIIYQLKQTNLTAGFPTIRELLEKLNTYVQLGTDISINIPFPKKNKRIKGKLAIHKSEEVVIVLKHEVFN